MKCLIIEDEPRAAEHLKHQIGQSGYHIDIEHCTGSVESSIEWLNENSVDLIFMDIQLGDGSSFEIFDYMRLDTPVIFTTSFNQFAIKAFEVNSVAYLLKPIKLQSLQQALEKYQQLYEEPEGLNKKMIALRQGYQKRFLVQSGSTLLPITVDSISHFRVHSGRHLLITTRDRQQFIIDHKLELLELRLDPAKFFRANRQYLVHIEAIQKIHIAEHGKIKIDMLPATKEDILVSKERATLFKNWLAQ